MNTEEPKTCLTDGSAPSPGWNELKENSQQVDYLVLCPEERAKGFVRPYRDEYIHVGMKPKFPLRDLTAEQLERLGDQGDDPYVKFEPYPAGYRGSATGKYWTQKALDFKCGVVTKMGQSLSETYARDPKFYGRTFCCGCGGHLPVDEFVWTADGTVVGS